MHTNIMTRHHAIIWNSLLGQGWFGLDMYLDNGPSRPSWSKPSSARCSQPHAVCTCTRTKMPPFQNSPLQAEGISTPSPIRYQRNMSTKSIKLSHHSRACIQSRLARHGGHCPLVTSTVLVTVIPLLLIVLIGKPNSPARPPSSLNKRPSLSRSLALPPLVAFDVAWPMPRIRR